MNQCKALLPRLSSTAQKLTLKMGEFIKAGLNSNYGQRKNAKYIYLTSTLDAAIWGAELALGKGGKEFI